MNSKITIILFLLFLMAPIQSPAQTLQCPSYYDAESNRCKACRNHPGGGWFQLSWRNYGTHCISCTLNCPGAVRTSDTGATSSTPACDPQMSETSEYATYIGIAASDPLIDKLARNHPAAASILLSMIAEDAGVTPVDWSSGFVPFTGIPTLESYLSIRQGVEPSEEELARSNDAGLTATYSGEKTADGYSVTFNFFADAGHLLDKIGGKRVTVRLQETSGESFVDLRSKVIILPLHKISSIEVDGKSLKL